MPLTGNRLGQKTKVGYVGDDGTTYLLRIDEDLAEAGGLTDAPAGARTKPVRFEPRGVWCQAEVAPTEDDEGGTVRKFIVCNAGNTLYTSPSPQTVEIDGLTFTTTGRRGERASY